MTEAERQRAIRLRLARMDEHADSRIPRGALPTGLPVLDAALGGGGLPRGCLVELFGPPACGKTSLALRWIAHAQQDGTTAAWIDAEHSFDAGFAAYWGVRLENFPVAQPQSAEEAMEVAHRLLLSGAVDLLVIDSAAALVPQVELEAGFVSGAGLHGRVLASALKRLSRTVAAANGVVVFLNQTRARMVGASESETSAGGAALKLHAAVRIELRLAGENIRFRVLKNRAAAPFAEGELRVRDGGTGSKCP